MSSLDRTFCSASYVCGNVDCSKRATETLESLEQTANVSWSDWKDSAECPGFVDVSTRVDSAAALRNE